MAVFLFLRIGQPHYEEMLSVILFIPFSLLAISPITAQTANPAFKIQQERKFWHDNIDREQIRLLALDGKADDIIQASKDENINLEIADVMISQVDLLQEKIETDSTLSGQMKIKNLVRWKP